jgi:Zn finger protein HypA/HybF involved in hydrogenase expression
MWNFWDLINIDEFEKRDTFNEERGEISFYCKDCKEIVETKRKNPKWYVFTCEKCKGKNVALGTFESLKDRFKIKK